MKTKLSAMGNRQEVEIGEDAKSCKLSTRSYNVLYNAGLTCNEDLSLEKIIALADDIWRLRNLGPVCLKEIIAWIEATCSEDQRAIWVKNIRKNRKNWRPPEINRLFGPYTAGDKCKRCDGAGIHCRLCHGTGKESERQPQPSLTYNQISNAIKLAVRNV